MACAVCLGGTQGGICPLGEPPPNTDRAPRKLSTEDKGDDRGEMSTGGAAAACGHWLDGTCKSGHTFVTDGVASQSDGPALRQGPLGERRGERDETGIADRIAR